VLSAIQLDDELCVGTEKVNDKAIDWKLPFELQSGQAAIANAEPE